MTAALVLGFLALPFVEIYLILRIGSVIGYAPTLVLLFAVSIAGGVLVRREGARAWRALQTAVHAGRLPTREVTDGALLVVGGALLVTPGFLTDAVGLLMVLPVTRPVFRRLLLAAAVRRPGRPGRATSAPGGPPPRSGRVIDVSVEHPERP